MEYRPNSDFTVAARVRSGPKDSQQSPHVTLIDFDDNPVGDQDFVFDKWFIQYRKDTLQIQAGRISFPFWKQNELFWDDDVTLAGAAVNYDFPIASNKLSFKGGYFTPPDGGYDFNGHLVAGQVVFQHMVNDINIMLAGGVFDFDGKTGAENLRNGNGNRDYMIWLGSTRIKLDQWSLPVTLGADVIINTEDYARNDPDPFTAANHDQTNGYVLSFIAGKLKKRGDWLAGYYYARIETLAVNAAYAQYDWMRWGTATQTDASDFKGHEFRIGVALNKEINILARIYMVDAITSVQDGKRFRIDLNYSF